VKQWARGFMKTQVQPIITSKKENKKKKKKYFGLKALFPV